MSGTSDRFRLKEALLLTFAVFAVVKFLWVVVEILLLPGSGVEPPVTSEIRALPVGYRLAATDVRRPPAPKKKPPPVRRKRPDPLKTMTLIGTYRDGEKRLAVIEKGAKIRLLTEGEEIGGYRVEWIGVNRVDLSRGGKAYSLQFPRAKSRHGAGSIGTGGGPSVDPVAEPPDSRKRLLPREEVDEYMKDLDKIWENIECIPHKTKGRIDGYEVRKLKRRSLFGKMGLKRGDIIVAVNGEKIAEMDSPEELLDRIRAQEPLRLEIRRGGKKVEWEYEIH